MIVNNLCKKILLPLIAIISIIAMSVTNPVAYGANSNNIAKVTNVKITVKSNKAAIKWKKVKKAKGYQIKISTSKKFDKPFTKTFSKKSSKLNIKLDDNKIYYIKVRAYQKINGTKKFGKWSKKKSFTIKKKATATGYWCYDGGTHHSIQNENVIGWYKTEEGAINAARKYNSENNYKTSHFQVDRCDFCPLYAAQVW